MGMEMKKVQGRMIIGTDIIVYVIFGYKNCYCYLCHYVLFVFISGDIVHVWGSQ
jgi:hypothetical protein